MSNQLTSPEALAALCALAHDHRLAVFRLLVRAGPEGMSAGSISEALNAPASSMSFHLSHLHRSGLITQRRESRSLIYSADYDRITGVIGFLMEDCCAGRPEICQPLSDIAARASCCDTTVGEGAFS